MRHLPGNPGGLLHKIGLADHVEDRRHLQEPSGVIGVCLDVTLPTDVTTCDLLSGLTVRAVKSLQRKSRLLSTLLLIDVLSSRVYTGLVAGAATTGVDVVLIIVRALSRKRG